MSATKHVLRVGLSTALLVSLLALTQQPPAASASGGKEGEGPEATACSWGYVECPDAGNTFQVTYTTRQCFQTCALVELGDVNSALLSCNESCDAACVNHGFVQQCIN